VIVHELGHSVGLDDLGDSECTQATMYGYSAKGDTFRSLIDKDTINCAKSLYGIKTGGDSSDTTKITYDRTNLFLILFLNLIFFGFIY